MNYSQIYYPLLVHHSSTHYHSLITCTYPYQNIPPHRHTLPPAAVAPASARDADLPSFEELLKTSDQQLFDKIQLNQRHLLYSLLPPPSVASQNYDIRPRAHNRQLPSHTGHLTDSNFITRMLFTDIYVLRNYNVAIYTIAYNSQLNKNSNAYVNCLLIVYFSVNNC